MSNDFYDYLMENEHNFSPDNRLSPV